MNKFDIASNALQLIGVDHLFTGNSFDDGSTEGETMERLYPMLVQGRIGGYSWDWCTDEFELGAPASPGPKDPNRWAIKHPKPQPIAFLRTVQLNGSAVRYKRWGNYIFSNMTENDDAVAIGTGLLPESEWPGDFVEAFTYELAGLAAGPLTKDPDMITTWTERAEFKMRMVRNADSQQSTVSKARTTRFAAARR